MEIKTMINHSRHGVIEEVATMIRTGASERAVGNYIDKLLKNGEITARVYDLLIGMMIDNY
jgi:transcriptional regulator CtsR